MRKTLVMAGREMAGHFFSPMAYVIGALFVFVCALKFVPFPGARSSGFFILVPGSEASLRPLFEFMTYAMVFVAPLLTMRLVADEYHRGTIETLMTAPISDVEVVLGKFFGVMGFYVALLATTVVFLALMLAYGQPDPGVAIMGYVGMLLLGAMFLSVGLFTSTLTQYQLVAAIVGIVILASVGILMQVLVAHAPGPWNLLASRLNVMTYFKDFSRGVFDTRGVVYFLSATALFLFLSVKTLESKRWR